MMIEGCHIQYMLQKPSSSHIDCILQGVIFTP